MPEATFHRSRETIRIIAAAALSPGQVLQLPSGRAGYVLGLLSIAAGQPAELQQEGIVTLAKTDGIVILDGGEVYWDHSANTATYAPADDKDFFVGTAIGDAASGASTVKVDLNRRPAYIIDLHESGFDHVPVLTSGTPELKMVGGTARAALSATAEAQKLDLLSKRSFPVGSNWILDAVVEVSTNCDADVGDLNVGVANGTHASDADAIGESCFFHFDMGGDLNLDAESDDDDSGEVAATDTTVDWAVGTPIHLTIDGRDESDIQMYVNGVLVLSGSAFTLAAASGPLKGLFHLEKSSNDSPGVVELHDFKVRIAEQGVAG